MLAAKKTLEDLQTMFMDQDFLIETKFDGERIQCHFNHEQIKFYSRNSNDYTHIYGPKMIEIIRENVSALSAILDGEIIVINKLTGEHVQFGMNKSVALENSDDENLSLCCKSPAM